MGYHPRIESADKSNFLTTRSRNSELWFVNNPTLEKAVLGYAAKYATRYGVKLYALAIEGNHVQGPALFPGENRADFMRDLNSSIARAVPRFAPKYPGGTFWGRRYSCEFLPGRQDVEDYFFYTVLQAVQDGLVDRISDYPGYNCFHDAIWGTKREFKVVRWAEYNAARRHDPKIAIKDFTDIVTLEYERLPGYEHLSQRDYAKLMQKKLEERRLQAIKARQEGGRGGGCLGREGLLKTKPGSLPKRTKKSDRYSHRPRILSSSKELKEEGQAWYFDIYFRYKEASRRYRNGEHSVEFPPGTYKPHLSSRLTGEERERINF